jgi:hypothetical protein
MLWYVAASHTEISPELTMPNRQLQVFMCHSSGDKPVVRDLYRRLKADGFAPWLDEEELLPGQDWKEEIPAAVRACDVVVICLSQKSVSKEGYLQREVRDALYVAEEKPEGTIFVIPVKLEEVEVPKRLAQWQWANLFQEGGYQRLVRALEVRASTIGATVAAHETPGLEEAHRKAREAEQTRLKADAERRATKEAQARETGEAKDLASVEAAEREAKVPPAVPQRSVSKPQPLPENANTEPTTPNRKTGIMRENPKDGLNYVWIPPGTFQMGCSPGDPECRSDENPPHQVTITRGFWIGQTVVTAAAYRRFAASTGVHMPPAPDFNSGWNNQDMPIVSVSWDGATAFCGWAKGRLPTEAEWGVRGSGGEHRDAIRSHR